MQPTRRQVLKAFGALSAGAALSSCGFSRSDSSSGTGATASGELTFTTWASDSELAGFQRAQVEPRVAVVRALRHARPRLQAPDPESHARPLRRPSTAKRS